MEELAVAGSKYEQARAVKQSGRRDIDTGSISSSSARRGYKKLKKSPLLLIIAIFLSLGAVGGFFLAKSSCVFYMNEYKVNGAKSTEIDYIYVDMSAHKNKLVEADKASGHPVGVTTGKVYSTMILEDGGVTASFLGIDITDSVTVKYYYREDISHDMVQVSAIDIKTAGVYYIEYTSSHFAYKNVKLIRTIIVTEVEVDG